MQPVSIRHRSGLRLGLLVALAALAGVWPSWAQSRGAPRPADDERRLTPLVRAVDAAMRGEVTTTAGASVTLLWQGKDGQTTSLEPATTGPLLAWTHHFLKSERPLTYVPFSVAVDPAALPSPAVVAYLRVVQKGATSPSSGNGVAAAVTARAAEPRARPAGGSVSDPIEAADSRFAYEDYYVTELRRATQTGRPSRLTRAFAVAPGDYEVYVALRSNDAGGGGTALPASTGGVAITLHRESVTVPDFWDDRFETSSILLAEKLEALNAPPSPGTLRERPYIVGAAELAPAFEPVLLRTQQLTVFFQIYNAKLDEKQTPDVTVEYSFERDDQGDATPFNRIRPQQFNAQTLPPHFDVTAGHQLSAGWSVPLASFPPGGYRLAITVTDNRSGQMLSRDVHFTVAGA